MQTPKIVEIKLRKNAEAPVITGFFPRNNSGPGAIIICPGGAYQQITAVETYPIGEWLAKHGIKAFVLNYRMPKKYTYRATMDDAYLAIQYVRSHAPDWQIDPQKIAIMGFSAGGHLASTVATHPCHNNELKEQFVTSIYSSPNFQILIYPVITMEEPFTHQKSRENLLGPAPSATIVQDFSNDKQVSKTTPPAFVYHAKTDTIVSVKNSDLYVESLLRNNIEVTYVRVSMPNTCAGGHGIGLDTSWTEPLLAWLRQKHF